MAGGVADLAGAISAATGQPFTLAARRAVGGGDINRAESLSGADGRRYFVKRNRAELADMFAAEAAGREEIRAAACIAAPRPVCHGVDAAGAYLVLEWLDLDRSGDAAELGRQLAALHGVTRPEFGWWRANTIGSTPQDNTPSRDWVDFWRRRRLAPQLELATRRAAPSRLIDAGARLAEALPAFFSAYTPVASLLHGDLWGGNHSFCGGRPVVFDPAVYYGDREADLAMTELFGGFPADFHAAYRAAWPLDPGYAMRKTLYNLYHILNHFNLFGGGYAGQAEAMTMRLLAEVRG